MAYIKTHSGRIIDYSPLMDAASSSQAERMAQLASMAKAGKTIGSVTSALGTVGDIAQSASAWANGIDGEWTEEKAKALQRQRTNTTINAGMSVVNLVLSLLATFGTGGAALPAMIGNGIQMATNGLLNGLNK